MLKNLFLTVLFTIGFSAVSMAQEHSPEMADLLRKDGKIYVVVLVLATIFAGIITFLVRLDRKISKLEKNK